VLKEWILDERAIIAYDLGSNPGVAFPEVIWTNRWKEFLCCADERYFSI
jgi:hypothetical protein